jgi:proteasome accessory factor A
VNGQELTAIQIQTEYFERVCQFANERGLSDDPVHRRVLDLWEKVLLALETENLSLIDQDIDWVIKKKLFERYMAKHDLELSSARIAQMDLAYHDVTRSRGLFYLLERRGMANRLTRELDVFEAKSIPPQTTRAKLRGDFIKSATEHHRDFTVDWVNLKLNYFKTAKIQVLSYSSFCKFNFIYTWISLPHIRLASLMNQRCSLFQILCPCYPISMERVTRGEN